MFTLPIKYLSYCYQNEIFHGLNDGIAKIPLWKYITCKSFIFMPKSDTPSHKFITHHSIPSFHLQTLLCQLINPSNILAQSIHLFLTPDKRHGIKILFFPCLSSSIRHILISCKLYMFVRKKCLQHLCTFSWIIQ